MSKFCENVVEHAKQNISDPALIDVWVLDFLVGLCRRNGMNDQTLALELRKFFDIKEKAYALSRDV